MNRDEPQLRRSNNAWLWYVSKMSAIVWSLFIVTIHVIEILMRNIGGGLSPIDVESIIAYYEMGAVSSYDTSNIICIHCVEAKWCTLMNDFRYSFNPILIWVVGWFEYDNIIYG